MKPPAGYADLGGPVWVDDQEVVYMVGQGGAYRANVRQKLADLGPGD